MFSIHIIMQINVSLEFLHNNMSGIFQVWDSLKTLKIKSTVAAAEILFILLQDISEQEERVLQARARLAQAIKAIS